MISVTSFSFYYYDAVRRNKLSQRFGRAQLKRQKPNEPPPKKHKKLLSQANCVCAEQSDREVSGVSFDVIK